MNLATLHRSWFGSAADTNAPIVLLHEGLGSVSAWKRFPQQLAEATGRRVLAYDRPGYGRSGPHRGPWPADFLHQEAHLLPALLAAEGITDHILVGHSDGASIALLASAEAGLTPDLIVSMSAHCFVEQICVDTIDKLRNRPPALLVESLARHHDHPVDLLETWGEVWTSHRFRPWSIKDQLSQIRCPVLAIQGTRDSFTHRSIQADRIAAAVGDRCEVFLLDCDHWPHREATTVTLDAIVAKLSNPEPPPS